MEAIEKEAMDLLAAKWSHLFQFGYPKKPYPTNFENDLNCVMLGLTSKHVEREKIKTQIEVLNSVAETLNPERFKGELTIKQMKVVQNLLNIEIEELEKQL